MRFTPPSVEPDKPSRRLRKLNRVGPALTRAALEHRVHMTAIGLDRQQVLAHSLAVPGVGTPDVAGAHPRFGVAFAERAEEVAPLAHPGLALDVLDPIPAPAIH